MRKGAGITRRAISDEEILERCLYAMINEGALILEEGVASRPEDIDTIWLNGYGFPRFRGGPMFHADRIGAARICERIRHYASQAGEQHWTPCRCCTLGRAMAALLCPLRLSLPSPTYTKAMSNREPPLCGISVLDMTRIMAGPWCTQNLADLGAEVLKIERPLSGDDTWVGAAQSDGRRGRRTQESAYYLAANRNKQSLALDIATAAGADAVRRLAAGCDIFVENFKVGGLRKYGLDYASLRELNPRLIYCSITGFGPGRSLRGKAGLRLRHPGAGRLDEHHR